MKLTILIFVLAAAVNANAHDLRSQLLEAAKKQDKSFPDGKDVLLTHFSHVCDLKVQGKTIHVVDRRAVLAGMPAPRGLNQISFFDHTRKYLSGVSYSASRPLWCEGAKLYLFGGQDGTPSVCEGKNDCNVIEWKTLKGPPTYLHEKKYGSSGGSEES